MPHLYFDVLDIGSRIDVYAHPLPFEHQIQKLLPRWDVKIPALMDQLITTVQAPTTVPTAISPETADSDA